MKYEESGIIFNNVSSVNVALKGKAGVDMYDVTMAQSKNPNFKLTEDMLPPKLVNALDIDWCGAELNGDVINSSAEFLAKVESHDKIINSIKSTQRELPAEFVLYYSSTPDVPETISTSTRYTSIVVETTTFGINDNSCEGFCGMARSSTPKYSVIAWPKTFGMIDITPDWKLYETKIKEKPYYAIITLEQSKSFHPFVVL